MSGWISLHRSIQEHKLWRKSKPFSPVLAWIDILLTVYFEESEVLIGNQTLVCKRGQYVGSLSFWATRWGWGVKRVRLFLGLLKNDSMIETETNPKWTRITVCKYDSYQIEGQTKGKQRANKGQEDNKSNNIINNSSGENTPPQTPVISIQTKNLPELVEPYRDKYSAKMIEEFLSYWTEKSINGKKERWQMQQVFEPGRRLATWAKRESLNLNNSSQPSTVMPGRIGESYQMR